MSEALIFNALDGSNPLAFLAAVGALRLLHLQSERTRVRMRWVRRGTWQPEVAGAASSEEEICQMLLNAPQAPTESFALLGENITVSPEKFSAFSRQASAESSREDRRAADFAAAFGCEACFDEEKDRIEYTSFCFITGSGHQHFLGTMKGLAANVTFEHLLDTLFRQWRRNKSLSMRWDPRDASEYALRWGDPSKEGASAVWGANLLAVEALPLLPAQPAGTGLRTTGFPKPKRGQRPQFTWPIWTGWASLDTVRSLLSLEELQKEEPRREMLREMGIGEIYRAQRVRIGQGANFKVSFRPARAL
jgi:hypothetical protein